MQQDESGFRGDASNPDVPNPVSLMTTRQVLDGREPVRVVFEADDGTMMFLCGTTVDLDDGVEIGLDRLLELDPSLGEVIGLATGLRADRSSRDGPWVIEPIAVPEELGVLTSRLVVDGTEPVRIVIHHHDGDWQFVCGTTKRASDAMIVGVNHLLDIDPTLEGLLDLPRGTKAFREQPGDPWQHEPYRFGRLRALTRDRLERSRDGTWHRR